MSKIQSLGVHIDGNNLVGCAQTLGEEGLVLFRALLQPLSPEKQALRVFVLPPGNSLFE